ncbi:MAG TPA: MFS transporter, partial [Verrucomicrobiae bacterium]|nr:MFS transporter [Verrucomicrobiae bacterium]
MKTPATHPAPTAKSGRNLYVFGTVSFFNDTASEMAYWILPAFLTSLGAGPAALGLIEGTAESVAALGKLFSGFLTDVAARRKPIVVFGYVLANVVKPVLALSTRWWHVLLIRFADRTAKGVRGTPRDVMLAESVDRKAVGSAYGLLQSMDSAGAIAGPLIAWLVMAKMGNMRAVFWIAAIPGLMAILVVQFVREPGRAAGAKTDAATGHEPALRSFALGSSALRSSVLRSPAQLPPRFFYILSAVLVFSVGNSSDMFLVLRAQQIGISPALAPLLGLTFNVTYTLTSWPAGWLSDRGSKSLIAALGYLVFAATYFIFAAAPSKTAVWIIMGFYGLYYSLTSPVLRALVVDTVAPGSRGRAFG